MGVRIALILAPGLALAQPFPEGPGRETFQSVCSLCHAPTAVLTQAMTRQQWADKVTGMLQEEEVSEDDREQIIGYLARNFPKAGVPPRVNVNQAGAKRIEVALALAAKDAEAIVRHREKNGSFKSLDDLKKVPGLDPAKIEAEESLVEF